MWNFDRSRIKNHKSRALGFERKVTRSCRHIPQEQDLKPAYNCQGLGGWFDFAVRVDTRWMNYQMKSVSCVYSFIHIRKAQISWVWFLRWIFIIMMLMMAMMEYLVDNRLIGWPKIFLAAMTSLYAVIMLLDFEAFMFQALCFLSCSFRFAQW